MSDMYFKSLPDTSTPLIPSNLDKLNDIKISPTKPTTNEKVWIQKGKNLYNPDTMPLLTGLWGNSTDKKIVANASGKYVVVPVEGGTTVAISKETNGLYYCTTATYPASGIALLNNWNGSEDINQATIEIDENAKYLFICLYNTTKLMVEYNSTATEYEAYIEKAIYVKNNNGVFEPFYKENEGKILWTNPNPSSTFPSKTITLNSDDYDMLKIIWINDISEQFANVTEVKKGYGFRLYDVWAGASGVGCRSRSATRNSDTSFLFDGARFTIGSLATDFNDDYCVPLYIIGYKTNLF